VVLVDYGDISKDVEKGYDIIGNLDNILREIENNRIGLLDTEKILNRGGIDRPTYDTIRDEILEDTCRKFIEYIDVLEDAEDILKKLKVIYTKMILELDNYRKGKVVFMQKADEYTLLRLRTKELKENIDKLSEQIENMSIDTAFFVLECFTEKALALNYLRYISKVLLFAQKIGDKWSEERIKLENKISELERKIEKLNEKLEEVGIRYSLGEFGQMEYDERRIKLENQIESLTETMEKLERKLEENDSFFLRIFEKLEELQKMYKGE